MKIIFLSLRKNILPCIFVLFTIALVIFSKSNLSAAKNGLTLWATAVVPSLFPFFVVTELLSRTNVVYYLGKWCDKIMRPLFNVPGEGAFAFIMGLISGYPVGAKIVANLREQGACSKEEGDRMLAFTNNSGPLFIISSVGIALFGDTKTGLLLLATHILACITVGIILAQVSRKRGKSFSYIASSHTTSLHTRNEPITFSQLGGLLGNSIQHAISTILMIGGFVVIFSVIISILKHSHILAGMSNLIVPILSALGFDTNFAIPVASGMIELTNGVSLVAQIPMKSISQNIVLCAFLLGFGGISILLQVFSLLNNTDLSIKTYVKGKFLQGIFAAFYTHIALQLFPFLNLDIVPTYAPIAETVVYPIEFFEVNSYFLVFLILLFIIWVLVSCGHKENGRQKYSSR